MIFVNNRHQVLAQRKLDNGYYAILDLNDDGTFFTISQKPYSDKWKADNSIFHACDIEDGMDDLGEYQEIYDRLSEEVNNA